MKTIAILTLLGFTLLGCSQGPKHPQAELINQNSAAALTEKSVMQFADSVDAGLTTMEKHTSLIYQIDDNAMYVEQYSTNGSPIVYKEYTYNETISSKVIRYYLRNDSLILIKESKQLNKSGKDLFEDKNTYLRNNIVFKTEVRRSNSEKEIGQLPYQVLKSTEKTNLSFDEAIHRLNDAVRGVNKFEMVFDNMIATPDERYLLLKGKTTDSYTANIKVDQSDPLIDSLLTLPATFKDKKLALQWKVADREAIYVPVSANVTSAKGLKR